jgi:hypothetical protein
VLVFLAARGRKPPPAPADWDWIERFARGKRADFRDANGEDHDVECCGTIALVSLVTPSAQDRALAREIVGEAFLEVYVAASVAVCEARDPKRLYRRARSGEIRGFTGVDAPYDVPTAPDLVLDTERCDVEQTVASAVEFVVNAARVAAPPVRISGPG